MCSSPWGHKESATTEWLNWTEPLQYQFTFSTFLHLLLRNRLNDQRTQIDKTSLRRDLSIRWLIKTSNIINYSIFQINLLAKFKQDLTIYKEALTQMTETHIEVLQAYSPKKGKYGCLEMELAFIEHLI